MAARLSTATYLRAFQLVEERRDRELQEIADTFHREILVPFCRRMGWTFVAGMGAWVFYRADGRNVMEWEVDYKRIPKGIVNVLDLEVDHMNTLGAMYMSDVR